MLTLLLNADVYCPEARGVGHVLVGGGKLLYIGTERPDLDPVLGTETLDLEGAPLIPGFVDGHVHSTGGGAKTGFRPRRRPSP